MKRRTKILHLILAGLLAAAAVWSYRQMAAARRAALAAREDLAECQRLARSIRSVREMPAVAAEHEKVSGEITRIIESAAASADVPTGRLEDIIPQPPRRVEDSLYKEKPTQVTLSGVTLRQLVKLAHGILSGPERLNVKWLRLDSPAPDDVGDLWNVEMGVTYLIYDPPNLERSAN